MKNLDELKVAVIGLGYVGLPLAVEFGKVRNVIAFDIDENRVQELQAGYDRTLEIAKDELVEAKHLQCTSNIRDIESCNCYIVAVPTPVDHAKLPDLTYLKQASESVAKMLNKGDIVVYESTVYPGATEDECVPLLEQGSGLTFNVDFFCGYSPERINPGDKIRRLSNVIKVTSGSTPKVAVLVDNLYKQIVSAGTYLAPSIKVAEAAKVIENTQRDLNIGLINEFAMLFHKIGIDTNDVLSAARTKWNFLDFRPGLVGGHCIGVDPYYLTYKASTVGYAPEIILAGRRVNDQMSAYLAAEFAKALISRSGIIKNSKVLVLGLTFKENCPDIRNSKVFDLVEELESFGCVVDVYDPYIDECHAEEIGHLRVVDNFERMPYDGVFLAVAHDEFREAGVGTYRALLSKNGVLFDIKSMFPSEYVDFKL